MGAGRRKRETDIVVYRAGPFQINWIRGQKIQKLEGFQVADEINSFLHRAHYG